MPEIDGYELCQRLKKNEETKFIPVVMVTSLKEKEERIKGLEVGADDFLTKPVDPSELLARVRSLLRIKHLHDELAEANKNLKELNETLEQRVKGQVEQIQKLNSMKRYISPQIVERLISEDAIVGQVKRKSLTVFFSDIRGFTKIADEMEPEELLEMLNKYFSEMTEIVFKYGGTLDKFMGDGIMGFIGDPCEYSDHAQRAVKMAIEMQSKVEALNEEWGSYSPSPLQIGIGVNTGYVTVGNIGSEAHTDYTAIGRNVNLAARLEQEAKPGQILISQRTYSLVKDVIEAEKVGEIEVKGFDRPVMAYSIYSVSDLK
jgi:class 3 adenylate cyclase